MRLCLAEWAPLFGRTMKCLSSRLKIFLPGTLLWYSCLPSNLEGSDLKQWMACMSCMVKKHTKHHLENSVEQKQFSGPGAALSRTQPEIVKMFHVKLYIMFHVKWCYRKTVCLAKKKSHWCGCWVIISFIEIFTSGQMCQFTASKQVKARIFCFVVMLPSYSKALPCNT